MSTCGVVSRDWLGEGRSYAESRQMTSLNMRWHPADVNSAFQSAELRFLIVIYHQCKADFDPSRIPTVQVRWADVVVGVSMASSRQIAKHRVSHESQQRMLYNDQADKNHILCRGP